MPHLKGSKEVQDEINVEEDVNDTLDPEPGALGLEVEPLQQWSALPVAEQDGFQATSIKGAIQLAVTLTTRIGVTQMMYSATTKVIWIQLHSTRCSHRKLVRQALPHLTCNVKPMALHSAEAGVWQDDEVAIRGFGLSNTVQSITIRGHCTLSTLTQPNSRS
jgi:hypothetical protein